MKRIERIAREFGTHGDKNRHTSCTPDFLGIVEIFIEPVLRQVQEGADSLRHAGHEDQDQSAQATPQEMLRFVFGIDEVTISVMMAKQSFELVGDVLAAPYRRLPGMRGLVVMPGAQVWVREDRRHGMVDLEVPVGARSPEHGGTLVWVSMTQDAFDHFIRGKLDTWTRDKAKAVRARSRNGLRRARMRRPWVQACVEFPSS